MFNKEPSEEKATDGLEEPATSAGSAKQAQPAAVGNKMMMIGAIPFIAFLLFVILAAVGIGNAVIGFVLLLIGGIGSFFLWKQASSALNSSLDALRDEAYAVANEDLPRLGHAISTGAPISEITNTRTAATFPDPAFASVAGGLNAVRDSAGGIGGSVAELQKGISDTYVNLARRNQALVDRQLEAIDTLEAEERDSDKLALLYRVDHLATRMHRNAESLLVLADAKTPERHSPAVPLQEVLRVAIGEVEDYRRIVPIALDELSVAGPKAQNMAHLLAELMENSAQHSPPGTAVDVTGALDSRTGDYDITILDHGTGMAADQMASMNELLEKPPTSTLTISHSIGLQVVSRIAATLAIKVRLKQGEDGGVVTTVNIPNSVVAAWSQGLPGPATAPGAPTPSATAPTAPAPAPAPGTPAPVAPVPSTAPEPAAPVASAADVAPAPETPAAAAPGAFPTVGIDEPQTKAPSPFQMPAPTPVAESAPAPAPSTPAPAPAEPEAPAASDPVVFEPGNSTFEMPKDDAPEASEPVVFEPGNSTFEMPKNDAPAAAPVAPPQVTAPEPTAPSAAELKPEPTPQAQAPTSAGEAPVAAGIAATAATAAAAGAAATAGAPTQEQGAAPTAPPSTGSTTGKLTKRTRSAAGSNPAADLEAVRTAPSQRSPDQVKSMLSRYKSGLERGRGPAETDGES